MLVAVFKCEPLARAALQALEALNDEGTIRLHADAVVTKCAGGAIDASHVHRPAPEGKLGGTTLGVFIGVLASAVGAVGAVGLAIAAAAGLAAGAGADMFRHMVARGFLSDVERALDPGTSAVVAQIYEERPGPLNERVAALGGVVFRRALTSAQNEEYEKQVAAIRRRRLHQS